MASLLNFWNELVRGFSKSRERKLKGFKLFSGDASSICKQVVDACWNGRYFMTSTGHFTNFWTRDFGWCSESLCNQGYTDKVVKSLEYAFSVFSKQGIGTLINPEGVAMNHPGISVDSLPWLVRSLRLCRDDSLVKKYEPFIISEANKLFNKSIDKKNGLVKRGYYASIKDLAVRHSSTYDNTMIAMLKDDLNLLGFGFKDWDIKSAMLKHLWKGSFFSEDLVDRRIESDANIFPYTTGVFSDKLMIESSMREIVKAGLDKPLPVKFDVTDVKHHIFGYHLVSNYQGTTVWTHMGPLLIKLMKGVDSSKADEYKSGYKDLIERYGTYLEVLNPDLTPYKSPFYMSDEGMLWAINYLDL